jgi:adenylate cyclase
MDDASQSTFLFADLAGFTALTEVHGDEQAADLAGEFFELVRASLNEHEAEEVKTIGDAILVRVPAASEALRLGLRITQEVAQRERFPVVRIGMHTGTATERAGDWFGASLNIAARVSAAASAGEVLLTEETQKAAGELEGIQLRRREVERLRNVSKPVAVYQALAIGPGEVASGPIDPVCRMAVDPGRSAGRLRYDGVEYCFCSLECARAFAAEPQRFVDDAPASER